MSSTLRSLGRSWSHRLLPLVALLLAAGTGCALGRIGGDRTAGNGPSGIDNPLFVPVADREFLWNQLVDELDDYFRIEREQRVQETGGVLTEGRIITFPTPGATLLEPWHRDSTPGYERWHASFQSIRRRAEVRVAPAPGGYTVEVIVFKELEDVNQPEGSTVRGPSVRHDGTLIRDDAPTQGGPLTLGWICIGRDLGLEQQILTELQARLQK